MSSEKPTVEELDVCLEGIVGSWKRFAHCLPGINQVDLDIIEENKRGDVVGKKLELYKIWLRAYPNASWDDVIKALEAVGENAIAKQLREKYPTKEGQLAVSSLSCSPTSGAVPMSPSQTSTVPEEVTVREEVVKELDTLQQSFEDLEYDVESGVKDNVKNGNLTVENVTCHLERKRAYSIPSLDSVTASDELFKVIRPHYNFLNCYLIINIALNFLSTAIAEKATEYKEKVVSFMKTTKIRSLQNTLKRYSRMFRDRSNTTVVEIAVENRWEPQDLWLVRNLITALFPVKHPDELPWYDIVPGSVVMTFIALEHMTPSLIESSRKKTEFMRLIGIVSVKIGNELVWKKESEGNKNPFSFEDSLIQATLAHNIEAVQFLLQYARVNVNAKCTTNSVINAVDGEIYWSQENVERFLEMNYTTFIGLLNKVEYEFQYVQGQMIAIDQDNFLNGRVLASLSDQLPGPLSTQVKQYQVAIDRITKQKALLIHLSRSLEKYFPIPFPDSIEVILTLHSVWRACSVWYVEQLGQLIFTPTLFHKLQWFRVDTSDEESLRVVLLADKELMDSLTMECLGKKELTSLLGVISVQVDDTVVISNDYSNGYTFNEEMHLAKAMENNEISNLLQQIQQSPVDFGRFGLHDENRNEYLQPEPDSTPLMIACCNNNSQLVQLLLDHNADTNIQTKRGYTALMYSTGNSKIFQMLLDRGAELNDAKVLRNACRIGRIAKIVKTILENNPEIINIPNYSGWTSLMEASKCGATKIVEILLEKKADPNSQDYEGATALQKASGNSHTAVVDLLLQARADPNAQDNKGFTALAIASQEGHTAVVQLLLQANANLNIRDNQGLTALDTASREGHTDVVKLLQAKVDQSIQ